MSNTYTICDLIQENILNEAEQQPQQPQKEPNFIQRGLTWVKKNPGKSSIAAYIIHKKGLDRKAFQMGKKGFEYGVDKISNIVNNRRENNKSFMQKHGKGIAIGGGAAVGALGAAVGTKALLSYLKRKKETGKNK